MQISEVDLDKARLYFSQAVLTSLVEDLQPEDLPMLGWSGGPLHIRAVAAVLEGRGTGQSDYLVIRTSNGLPVAKAAVDYHRYPDAGTIWQVATHPKLWGLGLATALIHEAEARIRQRGLLLARLGVELDNDRARRLYDHLGYCEVGQEDDSWPALDDRGNEVTYTTKLAIMEHPL